MAAETSSDIPFTVVLQWTAAYFVIHALCYLFCVRGKASDPKQEPALAGGFSAPKLVSSWGDIEGLGMGGGGGAIAPVLEALSAAVPAAKGSFAPLSYSRQTVRGLKFRVAVLPAGRNGARGAKLALPSPSPSAGAAASPAPSSTSSEDDPETSGPLVLECDIVQPPAEKGNTSPKPFVVQGSLSTRKMEPHEERRWWAHL